MTTYSYRLTLDDSDVIALSEAINRYIAVCKEELANGPKCPYWAHLRSLERISNRLCDDTTMTSTNTFGRPVGTDSDDGK